MIAERHPEHKASVRKAIEVVAADAQRYSTKSLDGRKVPADYDRVKKAWVRYRPAAHLWAAYDIVTELKIPLRARSEAAVLSGEAGAFLCEHLPLLLALAEDMRRFGEEFAPWAKVGPVLAGAETWKVPPDFSLPPIQLNLLPLPEPALRDLAVYEAR